jgi:tartrate dehydratase alpha subunit/fumarate hydratase class I-like protein
MLSVFIANPNFKNNTAAKVVLSVVPEMIVTVFLVLAGVKTRNISKLRTMNKA